jgi:catechol 2,3-dioxygenase-like lactoylglutathione lyase family enzyme
MPVELNHTIVHARDKRETADFLCEILGLADPVPYGPFLAVQCANAISLDVADYTPDVATQHYAFLVDEMEFDQIFARITERGLAFWADPFHRRPGELNTDDDGRGLYWEDPNGHNLEIITRPYGGGPSQRDRLTDG